MKILSFILFFFAMITPTYAFKCDAAPIIMHEYIEEDAYWDEETNEIHLSKQFLNQYSTAVQNHVVQHECGHANGIMNEMAADAYATARVPLTQSDVDQICSVFDMNYKPEKRRCEALQKAVKGK